MRMGKKEINWCESDRGLGEVKSEEGRKKKVWGESFITPFLCASISYLTKIVQNIFRSFSVITAGIGCKPQ